MPSCPRLSAVAVLTVAALLAGCGGEPAAPPAETTTGGTAAAPPPDTVDAEQPPGLVPVDLEVPDGMGQAPFDEPRQVLMPAGWSINVFARVPRARLLAWTPDDALLVSVPADGTVRKLTATDRDGLLLSGLEQPHGLAFAGNTLYVAESDQVVAYDYVDGAVGAPRVVAGGLPDAKSPDLRGAYSHALKSVAVGPDGAVYFSIGSTGNISAEDRDASPPRATIMRVPPGGGPAQPFATGVRNGTGLATAPDGAVWTAINNRDNIAYPDGSRKGEVDQDFVNDNPPESVARLYEGRELGWPYCNPAGGPENMFLVQDAETNPDGTEMNCPTLPRIEQSVGAHSAPLGMSFGELPAPFGEGALLGLHGSWNRSPAREPGVAFYAFNGGLLGNQVTLVGGFQAEDESRWGRPVAAIVAADGNLYISDDDADAVYQVIPAR